MILEMFSWTPDKKTLLDGLVLYNFGSYDDEGNFVPHPEVQISHIGPITYWGTDPETGGPVVIKHVGGHHANLRCFGNLAKWLIEGKPQYDEEGMLRSVFERTKLLDIIAGLEFVAAPSEGVPGAYVGPTGVALIDPGTIATPYNRWA